MLHHSISRRSFVLGGTAAFASTVLGTTGASANPVVCRSTDLLNSFGVCTHFFASQTRYGDSFDRIAVPALLDLGITSIRDDAFIYNRMLVESSRMGGYARLRALGRLGIKFSLICYDQLTIGHPTPPEYLKNILSWCEGAVEMLEGSNEPPLLRNPSVNPQISFDHYQGLYREAKTLNPSMPVAGPSYHQGNIAIAKPLIGMADFSNVHAYTGFEHPETATAGSLQARIAESRRLYGTAPVIVTEAGFHTAMQTTSFHFPVPETIKTRYLPRLLLFNFASGIKKTYLYQLIDNFPNDQTNKESNFGLVDASGVRKPSYHAVRNLVGLLKPAGPAAPDVSRTVTLSGNTQDVRSILIQRGDGVQLLAIWCGTSGYNWHRKSFSPLQTRSIGISCTPAPVRVEGVTFEDDGTLLPVAVTSTSTGLSLQVSDKLTILKISGVVPPRTPSNPNTPKKPKPRR